MFFGNPKGLTFAKAKGVSNQKTARYQAQSVKGSSQYALCRVFPAFTAGNYGCL
jgi:hypothetical protein